MVSHLKSFCALVLGILMLTATPAVAQDDVGPAFDASELMELSDVDLYRHALDVISREQQLLPGFASVPEVGQQPPPPPGANPEFRLVDQEGESVLAALDSRQLEVPESARSVLAPMPERSTGTLGPRPVRYEAALREVEQLVVALEAGSAGFAQPAAIAVIVTAMAVAVTVGMWVRGRNQRGLVDLAMTDGLTGLKNRRQLDIDFEHQRGRGNNQTALLMIDIDHFKAFNDLHGHAVGDEVLRQVGAAVAASVRSDDVPYRYGGEEFCVLLPKTDDFAAAAVADRVRQAIQAIDVGVAAVTASVGVASGEASNVDLIASEADRALYRAKTAGRNQVVSASSY